MRQSAELLDIIGNNFQTCRLLKGWSQQKFAKTTICIFYKIIAIPRQKSRIIKKIWY